MRHAELQEAGRWLVRHGLVDAEPTPLLASRLAARRRARLAGSVVLAAFLIGAALAHTSSLFTDSSRPSLLILTGLVVALLVALWLLEWWVRRADRRAGARLSRRVAHPVQLGWPAVLGRPYAVFAAATFAGAVLLAVSVLAVPDATLRYGAIVVLIGLSGVGAGTVMQLRHLLARPAVADDEQSLTADVIMRVEDARALVTPSLVWALPAILLYGDALGWWNAVAIALVIVGVVALCAIQVRTAPIGTVARQAMSAR
jgi:hypothetical protein